ncbi:MAG TPA: tRNA (5-methylaminomethyl-2-thiouridine)(34)-methyltransferase MnmD [Lentimicrobium sp.]|nr:tRNA (5-methylaminomethyl-2-thiouridine)(34)-methyltransferase MnmD [Lentimicrobium sp.]
MEENSIIITEDGSTTIFNHAKNEHFHSIHGAVQESMHVFINKGYRFILNERLITEHSLNILEVGFGTGLNALLTFKDIILNDDPLVVNYVGLEPNPIGFDVAGQLNYCYLLNIMFLQKAFLEMHSASPSTRLNLSEKFSFTVEPIGLQQYSANNQLFDLVYFDAFSPATQPELWDGSIFRKLYSIMNPGGVLVTYCSKGSVRRSMQQEGFVTERLPGPPGKHEMLRASKIK